MTTRARLRRFVCALAIVGGTTAALAALAGVASPDNDPDALFREREDLGRAAMAADIWETRLAANPRDYDTACKLSRARHWIGERLSRDRAPHFKAGMAAARRAIAIEPRRADGYFWLGANMGSHATSAGIFAALRYRGAIREAFETSIALNPTFNRGTAFCLLGKYYEAVPTLFGGSKKKSEAMLRRCLASDPESIPGHYYLAETLLAVNRPAEARAELLAVAAASIDPDYAPEARVWKRKAARRLLALDRAKE
jgi:cytochrome c-type biogenesis protein CcmH/NrfG